nr:MAG TPA: hypothetical protein [Caudoviricetes sp.]
MLDVRLIKKKIIRHFFICLLVLLLKTQQTSQSN